MSDNKRENAPSSGKPAQPVEESVRDQAAEGESGPGKSPPGKLGPGETTLISEETLSSLSPPQHPDATGSWLGKSLGKYPVTGILGKGGMGVVLKARDPMIERDVAIKVLAEHLANDSDALARFLAEARAAGKLNHPNVAGIYEIGQEGNTYFLVMEYVVGGSLGDRLDRQGPLLVLEATRAMIDAVSGIAAAHAAGLIHRDIKPANFLRTADGSIKVTDFGLAKIDSSQSQRLTQAGMVIGTPFFMSPEQCQGATADTRSDIYALGAAYYCLLTGKAPYQDTGSVPQVMYAHCHGEIPDPRNVDASIPDVCCRIVARAMAKSPDERYQTAAAMLADLEVVRATLSGDTLTALPSDSGSHVAVAASPPPAPPAAALPAAAAAPQTSSAAPGLPSRRPLVLATGGAALLVGAIAVMLAFWHPWSGATSGPANNSDGAAPGAAAPSGESIKVGVLHSLSGTMSGSESPVVDATLFAIDEVNRSGGVLGRPVKAIVADGRSDPDTFAREAERLITQDHVVAIFGCWTSASRKMVKSVVEEHNHLLVYPLQYEGIETSPNIIYMGAAPNQQILPAVDWAFNTLGKRRFFLAGSDYVFPHAANEIIKDELKRLGAEVVGEVYLPLGSSDVASMVQDIVKARPDMILNTINGDSNVAFFRALRSAGIKTGDCPVLSFSVGEQELRNLDPADIEGDYAAWTYFQSIDTPENRDFVARFHEKYPQRSVTDPMEAAYMGVMLWARAANDAGSLEPKKVRRAMLQERFASPDGEVRIDADTQHCYKIPRIGQIQADGRFHIVWSGEQPVEPEPYPPSRSAAEWRAFLHDLYTGWGKRWSAP